MSAWCACASAKYILAISLRFVWRFFLEVTHFLWGELTPGVGPCAVDSWVSSAWPFDGASLSLVEWSDHGYSFSLYRNSLVDSWNKILVAQCRWAVTLSFECEGILEALFGWRRTFYAHFVHWWIASVEVGAQSPWEWKGWWGFLIVRRPFAG